MTAPTRSVPGWRVERRRGSAAALHGLELPDGPGPQVWILEPDRPALVLGSTQPDDVVGDAGAHGVDVVRRRSGGGAVLLDPAGALARTRSVWIDLAVDRDDPRWDDDVARATWWVGERWAAALAALGLDAEVHRGPMVRPPGAELVCFAGVGPGEVLVAGRKVVGISQRRTRAGARFQCVVATAPGEPAAPGGLADGDDTVVGLLAAAPVALGATLRSTTGALAVSPAAVVDALLEALPAR